jgi:mycothiol synthase
MDLRPVNPVEDLPALDELFDLAAECDGHRPIGEHKYLDLIHPEPDGVAGIVAETGSELVAYVAIGHMPETNTCAMELAIHPMHRDSETLERMIGAGVERVRTVCGSAVRIWAFQPHIASVLEQMGFAEERELRQLRRSLPADDEPRFFSDVRLEGFVPGRDEQTWLDVNNRAFAGHPENGRWTTEVLEDRMRQPWFSARGVRMAWIDAKLAGFCWTKRHDDDLGEIYIIAVDPGFQGRGLGRALVLEGMRYLAGEGLSSVMLYVDADNRAGIALYEQLGFRLDHIDRAFLKAV